MAKVTKICQQCGKDYLSFPSQTKSKYCSKECFGKVDSKKITKTCRQCGKEYKLYQGKAQRSNYCSRECRNKGTAKLLTGKKTRGIEQEQLNKKGMWRCTICKEIKSLRKYGTNKKSWTGKATICKKCVQKRVVAYRVENPWKIRAQNLNNCAGFKYVTEQNLKCIWESQKGKCYYCGKDLKKLLGTNDVHTEHVINGVNLADNLVVSCRKCNRIKGVLTPEELESIARKIGNKSTKKKIQSKKQIMIAQKIREHCAKKA